MSEMSNFTKCFAVTDQHVIIPLRVVNRQDIHAVCRITTEIEGDAGGHAEAHHQTYFRNLWLDEHGLPEMGNVFVSEDDAKAYAIKRITSALSQKQREIDQLIERLVELNAQ